MFKTDESPEARELTKAISELHKMPTRAYLSCTGAGAGLPGLLQMVPGASRTLLGSLIPYDQLDLQDFIGIKPDKFVSREAALYMAVAAYDCASDLLIRTGQLNLPVVGLGLTAAITTDRPRRGLEHVHVAAKTEDGLWSSHTVFEKGGLNRAQQCLACDLLGLNALLQLAGLRPRPLPQGIRSGIVKNIPNYSAVTPFIGCETLLDDSVRPETSIVNHVVEPDGRLSRLSALDENKHIIFCGSFNPWHPGHAAIVRQAETMTGDEVVCSITAKHPVKGPIPRDELLRRIRQFNYRRRVMITDRDGLFIEKARRFAGFRFLIGYDVALSILNPKYYGGETARDEALDEFWRLRTTFLVCGRLVNGIFQQVNSLPVPLKFGHLFRPVTGRFDISSTDLR